MPSKSSRKAKNSKHNPEEGAVPGCRPERPNKSTIEDLKLFQNTNLLNHQDPLEQLQQQINKLIEDDEYDKSRVSIRNNLVVTRQTGTGGIACNNNQYRLSAQPTVFHQAVIKSSSTNPMMLHDTGQTILTIKKGVLWQQQNYDKFHQRLFSRWKKRYFILTTDYLVCFKRSSAKVGHSEMGKFQYKIPLGDVVKINWLRPKRSDKGPMILYLKEHYNLFLWSKKDLEEWMVLIGESIERLKARRLINPMVIHEDKTDKISKICYHGHQTGLYENATFTKPLDDANGNSGLNTQPRTQAFASTSDGQSMKGSTLNSQNLQDGTKVSSRSSSGSRKPMKTVQEIFSGAEDERPTYGPNSSRNPDEQSQQRGIINGTDHNQNPSRIPDERFPVSKRDEHAEYRSREKNDVTEGIKIPPYAHRIVPSYRSEEASNPIESDNQSQAPIATQRVEGRRSNRLERPSGNLIRRDDSWQSLVSLTQVGRTTKMQGVQEQTLYAEHAEPMIGDRTRPFRQSQGQDLLNIESHATPLRNRPPMRQHSMQSPRIVSIRQQRNSNSFDAPSLPSSPSLQSNNQAASYQQKLLQLRLLHSGNNIDFVRGGNQHDGTNRDYQVYGPGSTNHYGYYSMRSNLKSAASEFSFIRPGSSNFRQLPFQTEAPNINPIYASRASGDNNIVLNRNIDQIETIGDQHGAQISQASDRLTLAELMAPNRELPLKPNKRRPNIAEVQPNKSSLGSSIVCFFRRAFSKRSKRRPKLVESCSSSLAAFDSNFENIQITQSAFSTSSKSIRNYRAHLQQQQTGPAHKMIDLIEALANHTQPVEDKAIIRPDVKRKDHVGQLQPQLGHMVAQNSLISPLHRSSSMSASIDFGRLNDLAHRNQTRGLLNSDRPMTHDQYSSPLITRSSKVMSANLTPLFARKDTCQTQSEAPMSPWNSGLPKHPPRPSSIYGQPSMISSPIIPMNSMHGNRERISSLNLDLRRQQPIKMPRLDTTREVNEEVSSPTSESRDLNDNQSENFENTNVKVQSYSGSNHNYYYYQRKAVVNPVLQSPTMNTIYDNHPMVRRVKEPADSHYDNPRIVVQAGQVSQLTDGLDALGLDCNRKSYHRDNEAIVSRAKSDCPPNQLETTSRINHINAFYTPTHARTVQDNERVFVHHKPAAIVAPTTPTLNDRYRQYARCSSNMSDQENRATLVPSNLRQNEQHNSPMHDQGISNPSARSPTPARRFINQTVHYQQSPLVNGQTRVLKRGDGVQATIICSDTLETGEAHSIEGAGMNSSAVSSRSVPNKKASLKPSAIDLSRSDRSESTRVSQISPHSYKATPMELDTDDNKSSDDQETRSSAEDARNNLQRDNRSLSPDSGRQSNTATAAMEKSTSEQERVMESNSGSSSAGRKPASDSEDSSISKVKSRVTTSKARGSSTEQSDEMSSQTDSIEEPEEKDWVHSKLAQ